ncbi:MAG: class I SAM-dependent methyltransferase [Proteobacteria bacterium]|nr:class I SAM-dependent methyltransferase [Pseudomonadota bacterium]
MTIKEDIVSKCYICEKPANLAFMKNPYEIYRCSNCDFLFVNPYPSDNDIIAYYNKNYRGININFYPKARSRQRRAFLKSFLFWKYLFNKRVLDVGCGGGFMTNAFRRLGAEAHGMDISEKSIAYARNRFSDCTFHCEGFTSMAKSDLIFDFIFTTDLLEHIPGTREFMEMIVSISRPGTIIYLATPDAGHESVQGDLSSWQDICPPAHIQWFNQSNMAQLFGNYGFKLARAFTKKKPALSMLFQRLD